MVTSAEAAELENEVPGKDIPSEMCLYLAFQMMPFNVGPVSQIAGQP